MRMCTYYGAIYQRGKLRNALVAELSRELLVFLTLAAGRHASAASLRSRALFRLNVFAGAFVGSDSICPAAEGAQSRDNAVVTSKCNWSCDLAKRPGGDHPFAIAALCFVAASPSSVASAKAS